MLEWKFLYPLNIACLSSPDCFRPGATSMRIIPRNLHNFYNIISLNIDLFSTVCLPPETVPFPPAFIIYPGRAFLGLRVPLFSIAVKKESDNLKCLSVTGFRATRLHVKSRPLDHTTCLDTSGKPYLLVFVFFVYYQLVEYQRPVIFRIVE